MVNQTKRVIIEEIYNEAIERASGVWGHLIK